MLPNEIGLQILQDCDLESCLALGESLPNIHALLRSMDATLVREKVVARVPWMELDLSDNRFSTWMACARVIRARNRATQKPGSVWTSGSDFRTLFPMCKPKEVFIDPVNVEGALPQSYTPVFNDSVFRGIGTDSDFSLKGEEIHLENGRWNIKTLEVAFGNQHTHVKNINETGRAIVNPEDGYEVMTSNETVIHLRCNTGVLPTDIIAHRPTITETYTSRSDLYQVAIRLPSFDNFCVPFVHLLPNKSTKALVGVHVKSGNSESLYKEEKTWVYLIDTLDFTKVTLITVLPARPIQWSELLRENWLDEVNRMAPNRDFDVTYYQGLLYIYCNGRIVPLWTDCGIEDDDNITPFASPQNYMAGYHRTRLRTWFNTGKPVICTVSGYLPDPPNDSRLVREGKYITLSGTEGRLVGDLKTDTSYIARDRLKMGSFLFPGVENGQPMFYRWKRSTLLSVLGLLRGSEQDGITEKVKQLFNADAPSSWNEESCSDREARLGVYRNWAAIARSGFKFSMRDISFMAPNLCLKRMDHHEQ